MTMLTTIIGLIGLILVLFAFVLENTGKLHKKHYVYNWLNLVGSVFLIVYAIILSSWIFVILNTAWVLFAAYFLVMKK